jgi:hypothetical protein
LFCYERFHYTRPTQKVKLFLLGKKDLTLSGVFTILSDMTTDDLIKHFKSKPAALLALSLSKQCWHYWEKEGIPLGRQAMLEKTLFGRLKAGKQTPARRFRGKK